jgi:hypothetical protein
VGPGSRRLLRGLRSCLCSVDPVGQGRVPGDIARVGATALGGPTRQRVPHAHHYRAAQAQQTARFAGCRSLQVRPTRRYISAGGTVGSDSRAPTSPRSARRRTTNNFAGIFALMDRVGKMT